ncbi:flagellar hook-basal body complex protein [Desemzia sp. RIT804]|uniref:flagellar hook-basal body complex protein n=1 Tax=Desemzia sp. RIT 804 TaxID=2810209 RepID=UPI0019506DE3|nr:flagellar hook-basal body complex protein [Desemzia sp. RIT 804]MBM6614692.1 flagellar hook-basal body complex protein [Desemzia sp. RIT 804]
MLKSLYSGVTGMKSQQTKMDVISNNIANVSTTGFKSGRVRFEDMISQTNTNAQAGINAQQVGLGVQTGSIDTIMTGGSLQTTGRALDFGIENGDSSFFTVSGDGGVNNSYTRDGGFYTDYNGNLVTSSGLSVMGFAPTENGSGIVEGTNLVSLNIPATRTGADGATIDLKNYSVDKTGTITGTYSDGNVYTLGQIALTSFSNPDGLEKSGGNLYVSTANSGNAEVGTPGEPGYGNVQSGFLEMSNVDLANEFTDMIITNRAYQANSRSITTSDQMLEELINLKR